MSFKNWIYILLFLFAPLYSQKVKTPVERLEEVEVLFFHRQYEEAIREYSLLVDFEETAPEALYRMGECYYSLGEYDEAIYVFRDVIEKYADSYIAPEAIYACGIAYLARGDIKRAEEYLIKKVDEFPGYSEDKRILSGRGILLYFDGQYKEALAHFEKSVTKEGRFYKAKCLAHLGKPLEALVIYKNLADAFKDESIAEFCYFGMGDALFYNRDYAGAVDRYEFFIEKYPWSHLKDYARYKLGCSYFHEGNYEMALECFKYSADSEDRYLAAHSYFMLGEALTKMERVDEAISAYQEVKSSYPELRVSALANLNYGKSYITLGDTLNALVTFNQIATTYPTGSFAGMGDYLAGVTFFHEDRYIEAIERFQNIIRYYSVSEIAVPAYAMMVNSYTRLRNPLEGASVASAFEELLKGRDDIWVGRARFFLGELFYYIDRIPEAKSFYESVLQEYENVVTLKAPAFIGKAWCVLQEGRYGIAKNMCEQAFQRYATDTSLAAASLYGWGIASFNMGEYDEAYQVFLFGIGDVYPDHPIAGDAYYYGGKALFVTARYANAIEYWEKVINEYPYCKKAPDAVFDLATTYAQAADYQKGISYFNLLVNQYPISELAKEAQYQMAATYFNEGDFLNAIREFDKFRLLYPDDAQAEAAKEQMELAYYMLGQENPEALDILIDEHSTSEYAAEAQWTRAGTAFNDADFIRAITEFRKLLTHFPESDYIEDGQYYIIMSYGQLKNFQKQIEESEKFLNYFPESEKLPAILNIMGIVYHNLSKYEDAIKSFQRVLNEYPESEECNKAGRYLAQTYKAMGDEEKAEEYMSKYGQ